MFEDDTKPLYSVIDKNLPNITAINEKFDKRADEQFVEFLNNSSYKINQYNVIIDLDNHEIIKKYSNNSKIKKDISEQNEDNLFLDFCDLLDNFLNIIKEENTKSNNKTTKDQPKKSVIFDSMKVLYKTLKTYLEQNGNKNLSGASHIFPITNNDSINYGKKLVDIGKKDLINLNNKNQDNKNNIPKYDPEANNNSYYYSENNSRLKTLQIKIQEEFYSFLIGVLSIIYNQFVLVKKWIVKMKIKVLPS